MKTQAILIGFGPVGQILLRHLLPREGIELVGVVDIDPAKRGKTVRDLVPELACDVAVSPDLASVKTKADVALVATASKLKAVLPTLRECAARKLHVVSTCEELIFPWNTQPGLAREIDVLAKEHGVSILGTGVNPGFLMDFLPLALTAVCSRVDSISVERVQNATPRRIPFRQKIGANLTPAQFKEKLAAGNFGHVGLAESAGLIARALGWELTAQKEDIQPVLNAAGDKVLGIEQVFRGHVGTAEKVTLHFRATLDQPEPCDRIVVRGEPNLESVIPGAVHGDIATVAIVINAAARISEAKRGLVSMIDVPCIYVGR